MVRVAPEDTLSTVAALRAQPDVMYAEPNYIIRLAAVPGDPSFGNLWGLFNSGQTIAGVAGTAGNVVEVDSSDRVLYVELVLDLERDLVRATDEQ